MKMENNMSTLGKSVGSRSAGLVPMLVMWGITVAVLLQVISGGFIMETYPQLWHSHRWFGIVILAIFVLLRILTRSVPFGKSARTVYNLTGFIMLIQVSIGGMMAMNHALLKSVHLWSSVLLLMSIFILLYFFRYGVEE